MLYVIPKLSSSGKASEANDNNAISYSGNLNSRSSDSSLIQVRKGNSRQDLLQNEFSRSLKSLSLGDKANLTYSKVLPCLNKAWIMDKWEINGTWSFPSDAEEHYRDLNAKAAAFRVAPIHHYAGYEGTTITQHHNH